MGEMKLALKIEFFMFADAQRRCPDAINSGADIVKEMYQSGELQKLLEGLRQQA